jgi:hypothetical protein
VITDLTGGDKGGVKVKLALEGLKVTFEGAETAF